MTEAKADLLRDPMTELSDFVTSKEIDDTGIPAAVPTQKQLVTYGFPFGEKISALRDFQGHW